MGGGAGYQNKLQTPAFVKGVLLVAVTAASSGSLYDVCLARTPQLLLLATPLVASMARKCPTGGNSDRRHRDHLNMLRVFRSIVAVILNEQLFI